MSDPIQRRAEVPADQTTEEAQTFWDTHEVGAGLIAEGQQDPEVQAFAQRLGQSGGRRKPRVPKDTHVTTLRLDGDIERRLRHVAELKQLPYQTLLKQFVSERLYEEEKRHHVV